MLTTTQRCRLSDLMWSGRNYHTALLHLPNSSSQHVYPGSCNTMLKHQQHQQQYNCLIVRYYGSSRSSSSSSKTSTSTTPTTVWERQAISVKNTDFENSTYLDAIRAEHDPSLHIKTIEDELKGTIGKALGKQGEKILMYIRLMKQERVKYNEQQQQASTSSSSKSNEDSTILLQKIVNQYNEYRKAAIQARWELMVHRQAAGFIVNNNKYIMEHYPIDDALDVVLNTSNDTNDNVQSTTSSSSSTITTATVTATATTIPTTRDEHDGQTRKNKSIISDDQLDSWWQKIGRWK